MKVVWRAYELRPEPVPTLDPRGEYLRRVWNASVYPMAARIGLTMHLPTIQPRSRLAHETVHWARSVGRPEVMNEAIFRAFFERGEDIGEPAVLAVLASALGLDGEGLRHALEAHAFRESVLEEERAAAALGVTGVPAYVLGGRVVRAGVQALGDLVELVQEARGATGSWS